jgi:hypothetical protein
VKTLVVKRLSDRAEYWIGVSAPQVRASDNQPECAARPKAKKPDPRSEYYTLDTFLLKICRDANPHSTTDIVKLLDGRVPLPNKPLFGGMKTWAQTLNKRQARLISFLSKRRKELGLPRLRMGPKK